MRQFSHTLLKTGSFISFGLFLFILFSGAVNASYMNIDVEADNLSGFIFESEGSNDPYSQFTKGVNAYQAADYRLAAKIFSELAKTGYVNAQFYLAVMLDAGSGVDEDHVQSAMWYHKAAMKGHVEAQYNLGIAFATGEGVNKNIQKAVYWMKKAALNGSVNSQYNLGLMYILGEGVKTNMEEGILWWKLAAKNGDSIAQYNLGMIYMEGRGVESDVCEASRWWQVSADNGYMQSKLALEHLRVTLEQNSCVGMVSTR
jgi:TPR repeat protein